MRIILGLVCNLHISLVLIVPVDGLVDVVHAVRLAPALSIQVGQLTVLVLQPPSSKILKIQGLFDFL